MGRGEEKSLGGWEVAACPAAAPQARNGSQGKAWQGVAVAFTEGLRSLGTPGSRSNVTSDPPLMPFDEPLGRMSHQTRR